LYGRGHIHFGWGYKILKMTRTHLPPQKIKKN
jgi:hypothetical protein